MRTSLVVASFGAALTALTAAMSPVKAESAAEAYPYCLMGRGGGSTTCYFRTRAECGGGCVNNPAYVGEERARAILARLGSADTNSRATPKVARSRTAATATKTLAAIDAGARAAAGSDFTGWPTGYLVNRFGDRQAQGRF